LSEVEGEEERRHLKLVQETIDMRLKEERQHSKLAQVMNGTKRLGKSGLRERLRREARRPLVADFEAGNRAVGQE
jgi:hypothetical protein